VRLEGLGQLKKSNNLIGNRTRNLPACSTVPQPSTLPRAPTHSDNTNIDFLNIIYRPVFILKQRFGNWILSDVGSGVRT
jgi:hypothetical protein